jgi:hypothetical protein
MLINATTEVHYRRMDEKPYGALIVLKGTPFHKPVRLKKSDTNDNGTLPLS